MKEITSIRTVATVAFLLFLPVVVSFAFPQNLPGREYLGIFFHLTMFFLVARLRAPEWAKGFGYGWLTLDVAVSAMLINGVPLEIGFPLRLGGHILAGLWIVTASSRFELRSVGLVGVATGVWLGGFTFIAPFVPEVVLGPASPLFLLWLVLMAWKGEALYAKRQPRLEQTVNM